MAPKDQRSRRRRIPGQRSGDPNVTQAADELRRLRLLIKQLKRMKFGYSLEHADHSLFELGLEDLTQCIASAEIDQIISDEGNVVQYLDIYETWGDIEFLPMYPTQLDLKIVVRAMVTHIAAVRCILPRTLWPNSSMSLLLLVHGSGRLAIADVTSVAVKRPQHMDPY